MTRFHIPVPEPWATANRAVLGEQEAMESLEPATGIVGATAVLVEVVEELRQTARTVRESRADVVGQLPAIIDAPEAARILGITEEALRSRLKRGMIDKTWIYRTASKKKRHAPHPQDAGKRRGNSGRVQFWRARLTEPKV